MTRCGCLVVAADYLKITWIKRMILVAWLVVVSKSNGIVVDRNVPKIKNAYYASQHHRSIAINDKMVLLYFYLIFGFQKVNVTSS